MAGKTWQTREARRREPYYRRDLALVHHRGFGFHAEACAPGVLALLRPVLARDGLVLEIGCGSGLLTRELVDAGLGVSARLGNAFGDETLPEGLRVISGTRDR